MAWTGRVPGGVRKGWYDKATETTLVTDGSLHDLITTDGIELGKNVFHLIGMDRYAKILRCQKLARGQPEERLAGRPPRLIDLGACAGAHRVGRRLAALGHKVR